MLKLFAPLVISGSKRWSSFRSGLFRKMRAGGQGSTLTSRLVFLFPSMVILLCLFVGTANAANWYVRPSASGSSNGTNWSNAWSLSGIAWSNVSAGDTVWLAGGSYSGGLSVSASGSSGHPITISRVTSSDATPVAAAGWSASFDSQVVLSGGIDQSAGSYVVVDGHKWTAPKLPTIYGIIINLAGSPNSSTTNVGCRLGNNCTLRNVEIAGPGYNVTQNETDGIIFASSCLVSGCKVHGLDTAMKSWIGTSNVTVEYTTLFNISSNIVNNPGVGPHPDAFYSSGQSSGFTFRYNVMANVVSEAFFYDMGGQTGTVFYGNLFFQGDSVPNGSSAIQVKEGYSYGTFFLYNNTFVDWTKGVLLDTYDNPPPVISSSSVVQNNLFVNTSNGFDNLSNFITTRFNGYGPGASSSAGAETNKVTSSVNPFVSPKAATSETVPTGFDPSSYVAGFMLNAGSWPIGKGSDLGPPYDIDMNGNSIGSTIGAFAATATTPGAPQNFRLTTQ